MKPQPPHRAVLEYVIGPVEQFQSSLLKWYDVSQRHLPWRTSGPSVRPDPYGVLVSELMLQQTQVATVVPYFHRFVAAFPSFVALATADEQDVLRLWQGLGYYSRARNLHRAARVVAAQGLPTSVAGLLELPGVGRYTAGAIASIALGLRAPILDGNVTRVLCRLDAIVDPPSDRRVQTVLWQRAEAILPDVRVGDFNSALMELGATICTPKRPHCLICPVAAHCQALREQLADRIPPPKAAKPTPLERRIVIAIRRDGRWLLEQRPSTGRWAGLWQFVTRPQQPLKTLDLPVPTTRHRKLGMVRHQLTHRRYEFEVRWTESIDLAEPVGERPMVWTPLSQLHRFPLSKPQLAVAELLRGLGPSD